MERRLWQLTKLRSGCTSVPDFLHRFRQKTFSSGDTLGAIRVQLDSRFEDMLYHIVRFSVPTLCLLNGSVHGGVTDLALCCDFRIGVHYYPGGIWRYVTVLGLALPKSFLTAQAIGDVETVRISFSELTGVDRARHCGRGAVAQPLR